MSGLAVRRGEAGDLDRLEAIENTAFDTDQLSRDSLRYALKSAASALLVAERDGRVEGYALVNFRKGSSKARLFSLARAPDAKPGCGRALLAAAEAETLRRGKTALRLEVRESNSRAIALYEKSGYRRFGRHAEYYEDGAPALRFEKHLVAG